MRLAISLLVLPLLLLGVSACEGDMACIQWSEQEGACPAPDQALLLMKPPCDEPVVSVDGDGEFDGQACCYEVTKEERDACGDAPAE